MKFLVDNALSPLVAAGLRKAGHDVAFCEACGQGYTVGYLNAVIASSASARPATDKPPPG